MIQIPLKIAVNGQMGYLVTMRSQKSFIENPQVNIFCMAEAVLPAVTLLFGQLIAASPEK